MYVVPLKWKMESFLASVLLSRRAWMLILQVPKSTAAASWAPARNVVTHETWRRFFPIPLSLSSTLLQLANAKGGSKDERAMMMMFLKASDSLWGVLVAICIYWRGRGRSHHHH